MRNGLWILWALFLGALPLPALAMPTIQSVAVEVQKNGVERLIFKADSMLVVRKAYGLGNPDRIVIDLSSVKGAGVKLPSQYRGALIQSIRFGQFDFNTSRIVVDLKAPAKVVGNIPGNSLMIDIAPAGDASKPSPPSVSPPSVTAPTAPTTPKKLPLVMIDAGHGGQDPGALGLHKTREKDITLNYARALQKALLATGRYRAQLTRDDDVFVKLPDRVAIARAAKADMFISFHADSNPRPEAHGLSIYTLSENASDDESAALAERENKADIIPGLDLNTTDADVASILIDLTQRETMNKSSRLADAVVASLDGKINPLMPGTHRFAGFRVLKAPDIPSVLIELGFLSNPTDERLLLTQDYRDRVVASIVKGIDRYRAAE